jgi:hypothetical protein
MAPTIRPATTTESIIITGTITTTIMARTTRS